MAPVSSDIKNGIIKNVYLFYGEESFKKRNYKRLLIDAVTSGNSFNLSVFEGKHIDWQAVYDSVVTVPLFAPKRLVIVENSEKFKARQSKKNEDQKKVTASDEGSDLILEKILSDLPKESCLAFFEDAAAKNKRIYKNIAEKGLVVECNADTEETVLNWLARGCALSGKKVRKSTLQLLINRVGTDYDILKNEIDKITAYTGAREVIEDSDVFMVSCEAIESKIFDMLDAMGNKRPDIVIKKYNDLIANREHPLYILAMIRNQFRNMLQISEFNFPGASVNDIAAASGKKPFVVRKTIQSLRYFSPAYLENILDDISDIDKKCKSGDINDQLAVELLLIKYSA